MGSQKSSGLVLRNARISDSAGTVNIEITDGKISKVSRAPPTTGAEEYDLDGNVVLPSFVEPHIHPDKAYLLDRIDEKVYDYGTLEEALAATAALKSKYTFADVKKRSSSVFNNAILNGTLHMRVQPDVDHFEQLLGVKVLLELRKEYSDFMDIQIVAFPQEGFFSKDEAGVTEELIRKAIEMGADIVGGAPYRDSDYKKHIDLAFALAKEYRKDLDFHVYSESPEEISHVTYLAKKTIAEGYQGRVTVGHLTNLAVVDQAQAAEAIALLRQAQINVVCLPATDLYFMGRKDTKNVKRGLTRVKELLKAGVNVALSSNNIRNAFTPFGNVDMLEIGLLLAQTAHMGSPSDQSAILNMCTYNGAKILGVSRSYGIEDGKDADLVVLATKRLKEVLIDQPERLLVLRHGKVIARSKRQAELLITR